MLVSIWGEGFFDRAEEAAREASEGGADFLLLGSAHEGCDVEFFAGGNGAGEVVDDCAAANLAEGGDFVWSFSFAEEAHGFADGVAGGADARIEEGRLIVGGFESLFIVRRQILADFGGEGVCEYIEFLDADSGDAAKAFARGRIFAGHVAEG